LVNTVMPCICSTSLSSPRSYLISFRKEFGIHLWS
jgi:hypothetical protein